MRIYVASSWKNVEQIAVVRALQACGHEVYDFRHPAPGNTGFSWSEMDPLWRQWTPDDYRKALQHPIAMKAYAFDVGALQSCDVCVLVLPSGRSASWEFGYAMGRGKRGYVLQMEKDEPELMYSEATILTTFDELFDHFAPPGHELSRDPRAPRSRWETR
jgi:nucleoside 2-deoxyribosyltransferase